jgi:inorganic pyrophosphatase
MSSYKNLPPGERAPEIVNVVIEIPKGSGHKYEYDPDLDVIGLDRRLYSPMHYPGDYGSFPALWQRTATPSMR